MKIEISVIIPAYNAEKYLQSCLDSVAGQTFVNFEVIVVDDCSTDQGKTSAIVQAFADKDPRFRLIVHTQNLWQGEARNSGVAAARGKYVAFLDSDDRYEPDMLQKLYQTAERTQSQVTVCGFYNDYGKNKKVYLQFPKEMSGSGIDFLTSFFHDFSANRTSDFPFVDFAVWNKLILREWLLAEKIRNLPGRVFGEDIYYTFLLLLKAPRVSCIPDVLYNYFLRNPASSNATGAAERLISTLTAYHEIRQKMIDADLWSEEWQYRFYRFVGYQLFAGILRTVRMRPAKHAREILCALHRNLQQMQLFDAVKVWPESPQSEILAGISAAAAGGAVFSKSLCKIRYRYLKHRYVPSFFLKFKRQKSIGQRRKVLVIRPDQLGDFCLALPYLAGLRTLWPAKDVELVLLGHKQWIYLAEKCLPFDRFIPLGDTQFLNDKLYRGALLDVLECEHFDCVIEPRISRYVALDDRCRLACKAPQNFAFSYTPDQAYSWKIMLMQKFVDLFRMQGIAKPFASELSNSDFFWETLTKGKLIPEYNLPFQLAPSPLTDSPPFFVLLPGAGKPYKEFPPQDFVAAARSIIAQAGLRCVVAGGPEHWETGEFICSQLAGSANLCGKTSIWEFAGLLRDAKLVLGNDTGGIHLAALIGTPSVAIVGGGAWGRFLPYPEKYASRLALPVCVSGAICQENCNWQCGDGKTVKRCITSVTIDAIVDAAITALEKK